MDMDEVRVLVSMNLTLHAASCLYGGAPAKVVYAKSVSVNAMQIVYHGAYRRVCVNATKTSFGGGTENPYLCSAMRFRVHGTSCMYNYVIFGLWKNFI